MAYKIKSKVGQTSSREVSAYNVYLNGKRIDRVHWYIKTNKEDVKKSLVEHDGYDSEIKVVKSRSFKG
jgi:hypothetical protein